MSKVLELARKCGAGEPESLFGRTDYVVLTKYELERFYTLARADLEAELAAATSTNAKHVDLILRLEAENARLKKMYALLASAWFYGNWKAETHNERAMQKLMEEAGYWPTTESEIVARAALGEQI